MIRPDVFKRPWAVKANKTKTIPPKDDWIFYEKSLHNH